jgi:hypothetical protein
VSVELFRDDDCGYAAWLAANRRGYVLNIQRTLNPSRCPRTYGLANDLSSSMIDGCGKQG